MKKVFLFVIVIPIAIAITSVLSIITYASLSGDDDTNQKGVLRMSISSKILNEERDLIIHLPLNYDSTKIYPVMYVLDGGAQDQHIANKFDVLTTAGYTPPTIIVGIPNMTAENREQNLTPPFMRQDNDNKNSKPGDADKFLRFMESELFPFMEKNYNASQTRLISGNSRGGLLAMYSLVYKPDMFAARFCYSTPFWRQDNILVTKVRDLLNTKDTLNTFFYLSAGENETNNIKNGLKEMTQAIQSKTPIGLTLFFDYTPNATHQDNAILSAAKGIARWSEYVKR